MKTRVRRHRFRKIILVLVAVPAYFAWCLLKPLPDLKPQNSTSAITVRSAASALVWPPSQAAVSIVGTSILETSGKPTPVPTASTAKIITALMVLKAKPLKLGEQGPTITIADKDVTIYRDYVSRDGSVVPVQTGEQISQYKALQTVMLPSANNIADTLAIWAYGSLAQYSVAANQYLRQQGINNTTVGSDASGLAANSTSTASDLVKIGVLAMQDPVLAQIVGQSTATNIPIVGMVKNVNDLIGVDGIIGIKTGNSEEAGGAFVAASKTQVNDKPVTIVSAVVGAPSLFQSMKQTLPLNRSAQKNFSSTVIVQKGQVVGKYFVPWSDAIDAIAGEKLSLDAWNGSTTRAIVSLETIPANGEASKRIGSVSIAATAINDKKRVSVTLKSPSGEPSLLWRLTHPLSY